MFSTLLKLALLAAPVLADFAINSPQLTQCKDAKISWEGTKGPYNLIVVNSTDPCGDSVADLGDHDDTQITWKVALPGNYKVQLSLEDANGDEAWSSIIEVEHSDDTSCLPASLKAAVVTDKTPTGSSPQAASGSTVVVTPTLTVGVSGSTSSDASPSAVGAANAGANPLGLGNGAPTLRQASTPVMVLGAFAAVLVASL